MKSIWVFVLAVLAVLVGGLIWKLNPKIPDGVGSYVLFLTLIAILMYTRETHKLRDLSARQVELSQEQTELSLKPHLEIIFQRAYFRLHNIGNGPAVHINVDDLKVVPPGLTPHILRFICPPVIKKGESLPIDVEIRTHDAEDKATGVLPGFFTPPLATETYEILIHCKNLTGREYKNKLIFGKDVPTDNDPADFLLQYLYEKFPARINPGEIPNRYVNPSERTKLIQYCRDKGFVEAIDASSRDGVAFLDARITSTGIDYIRGKE